MIIYKQLGRSWSLSILICIQLMMISLTDQVEARNFRTTQFPHGSSLSCSACHFNARGGGALNGFGYDVSLRLVGGNVDWPALCALDSDEDGFTNAEELGDPNCVWREGSPQPDVSPTAPGDSNSFPRPMTDDMMLPDMMVEDMALLPDLAPPRDAALPVDLFIDIWDATLYDWGQTDAFSTTEDPWVAPDFDVPDQDHQELDIAEQDLYFDQTLPIFDQTVEVTPDGEMMGESPQIVDAEITTPKNETTPEQSGCQQHSSLDYFPFVIFCLIWILGNLMKRCTRLFLLKH